MKKLSYLGIFCVLIILALSQLFSHRDSFVRIPIMYDRAGSPLLDAKIEEKTYPMKLDLGSKSQIDLSKTLLDSLEKKPYGTAHWRDAKGNFYEAPSFLIPKMIIGNAFALKNLIAIQKNDDYEKNTTVWDDEKNALDVFDFGSLGRPLLEKTNIVLDFPHSAIFLCKDKSSVKKAGFSLEKMIEIPLELTPKGMIIKTETDQGVLRLLIDTCASISFVRTSHLKDQKYPKEQHGFEVFTSSQFFIEGEDFGKQKFFLYDITPELHELDGVLGMDFLKKHIIYIDYSSKSMFIEN